MARIELMWECKCGHVEYGIEMPDECIECSGIDSFTKVPGELAHEREKEIIGEADIDEIQGRKKTGLSKAGKGRSTGRAKKR